MNIAQNWRMNAQRYAMQGIQCEECGATHIVPREVCPNCQAKLPVQFTFEQPILVTDFVDFSEANVPAERQAAR
jgi:uncharacterized OB-fold protein